MKVCRTCELVKPLIDFKSYPKKSGIGYSSDCRACKAAYANRRYHENPSRHRKSADAWAKKNYEKIKAATTKYRRKKRLEVVDYLGGKCTACGLDEVCCLQIDHIDGGGNKERKKITDKQIQKKILAGAKGYQLLCANCNWRKREKYHEVR